MTPTAMSTVVIDTDGDVLLQLLQDDPWESGEEKPPAGKDQGLETQVLTVSSKVLSLGSPVFKAMLSGRFKEGIELAQERACSKPYTLSLHDDDPEAAIILCRILHFSVSGVPERPTPACLEKLAFICDKYQCTFALRYCGSLWLRDWLLVYAHETPSIDDLCRLLIFAYVIDLPQEFLGIAWKLFLFHKGPFIGKYSQVVLLLDHPLLSQDVARDLNNKRFECCQTFHNGVMYPVASRNWYTMAKGCHRAAKALGDYHSTLRDAAILSYDLEFTEHRFCDLLRKACALPVTSISDHTCTLYNCPCRNEGASPLCGWLKAQVSRINERQNNFACLDCLKSGGRSKGDGKCRVVHP